MTAPPGLPARRAALGLLGAVLRGRRTLDEALGREPALAALAPRDRAFARALAAACLRRLGSLDDALDRLLAKPLPPRAEGARDILRLGAAQLLVLGTPAHAAVATSVALASGRLAPWRGLANAVLRRLAREAPAITASQDAASLDVPAWLREGWSAAYGEAQARAIARATLVEPPLDLTPRDPAELDRRAAELGARILPTRSLRLAAAAPVDSLPGFAEGAWWVQDAAAALPARLFGPLAGRLAYDLCAAPGGKTLQLAAAGARVVAVDRSAARLARMRENLARTRLDATVVAADVAEWRPGERAHAVLLDAPCSATGTLRRHPDGLRLKRPEDLPALVAGQDRLLDAAAALTAPGGTLVYAVCSLEPAEGSARVAAFLARRPEFRRRAIAAEELALPEAVDAAGDLRTLPSMLAAEGGLDGFYAARLERAR